MQNMEPSQAHDLHDRPHMTVPHMTAITMLVSIAPFQTHNTHMCTAWVPGPGSGGRRRVTYACCTLVQHTMCSAGRADGTGDDELTNDMGLSKY